MKIRSRFSLLFVLFSLCTLLLPGIASAGHCGSCRLGVGIIHNDTTGNFYPVGMNKNIVYRSVDGKYVPVMKYGYVCYRHHNRLSCYCKWPRVVCHTRCAHWEGPVWVSPSNVCNYVR
jgi:hypothetical protein